MEKRYNIHIGSLQTFEEFRDLLLNKRLGYSLYKMDDWEGFPVVTSERDQERLSYIYPRPNEAAIGLHDFAAGNRELMMWGVVPKMVR